MFAGLRRDMPSCPACQEPPDALAQQPGLLLPTTLTQVYSAQAPGLGQLSVGRVIVMVVMGKWGEIGGNGVICKKMGATVR